MTVETFLLGLLAVALVAVGFLAIRLLSGTLSDDDLHGPINAKFVCPHCHQAGAVRLKLATVKDGISGAKATGALLTGGASILVTGLSKKAEVYRALCGNCKVDWTFS